MAEVVGVRLVRRYARGAPALVDGSIRLPSGSFTALRGASGSGKSTLLRILACVDRPDSGALLLDGREVGGLSARARRTLRRYRIGSIFQAPTDNLLDHLTVREHFGLAAGLRGTALSDDDGLIAALGLEHRAGHLPRQLSGGEQQRVAIGFAAVGGPALLVLDEPTGQLDRDTVTAVLGAFAVLTARGTAIVAATHDPSVADRADQVFTMTDGRVDGP